MAQEPAGITRVLEDAPLFSLFAAGLGTGEPASLDSLAAWEQQARVGDKRNIRWRAWILAMGPRAGLGGFRVARGTDISSRGG